MRFRAAGDGIGRAPAKQSSLSMSAKKGNEKDAYVAAKIFLVDVNIGISLIPDVLLSYRKSSSNGHPLFSHPVDVSASPTVAESKARFMREFGEENGSSLGLRDKKVRHKMHPMFE